MFDIPSGEVRKKGERDEEDEGNTIAARPPHIGWRGAVPAGLTHRVRKQGGAKRGRPKEVHCSEASTDRVEGRCPCRPHTQGEEAGGAKRGRPKEVHRSEASTYRVEGRCPCRPHIQGEEAGDAKRGRPKEEHRSEASTYRVEGRCPCRPHIQGEEARGDDKSTYICIRLYEEGNREAKAKKQDKPKPAEKFLNKRLAEKVVLF